MDQYHDEYVSRCPACGDPIDYCQGHGQMGDPDGFRVLELHDNGVHVECHPEGCEYALHPVEDEPDSHNNVYPLPPNPYRRRRVTWGSWAAFKRFIERF